MVATGFGRYRTRLTGARSCNLASAEGLLWYNDAGTVPPRVLIVEKEVSKHVSASMFTPEMTVEQVFKVHAGARRIFARYHLGGCSHCAISETHQLGQIAEDYGIPLELLLADLNKLAEQPTLAIGQKVRLPEAIRAKVPELASVPEIGEVTGEQLGAYTVEFGEVRLQGLAEDFIPAA